MPEDPLGAVVAALRSDARCTAFTIHRGIRTLYRAIADEGPIETVALTHPSTSTEFFVGWTSEGAHRLRVLLPGPLRKYLVAEFEREQSTWTEDYRAYRERDLNARAYLFQTHATPSPDLAAPFYGVWAAEEASLHAPGHDDSGDTRSDGRPGLSRGMFASADVHEVVDWLVHTVASLEDVIDGGRPAMLKVEQSELASWPARLEESATTDARVAVAPEASRIVDLLDAKRVYAMFPRDPRGRPVARRRVLLQAVSPGSDRDPRPWIVAIGPSRAGGREITIGVERAIAANQLDRFDVAPWCWRRDAGDLHDRGTWGYTSQWDEPIARFLEGRVKEGLEASGLRLDEAVSNLAKGSHIGLLHPDPDWPKVTRDQLCRLAPWLMLGPGLAYARALLKRKSDGLRLFTLPNQRAIRKASIVLVPGTRPSIEIRWTGTNARLPLVLWQRPPIPGIWGRSQAIGHPRRLSGDSC